MKTKSYQATFNDIEISFNNSDELLAELKKISSDKKEIIDWISDQSRELAGQYLDLIDSLMDLNEDAIKQKDEIFGLMKILYSSALIINQ